jgi:hypothetical protein
MFTCLRIVCNQEVVIPPYPCAENKAHVYLKEVGNTLDAPCEIIWTLTPFLRRTLNAWQAGASVKHAKSSTGNQQKQYTN